MRAMTIASKITAAMASFGAVPILLLYAGFVFFIEPQLQQVSLSPFRMDSLSLGATFNRALGDFAADMTIQATARSIAWDSANWRKPDGGSPITHLMNGEVAGRRISNLTIMLAVDGSVLAVNSADKEGKPLATAPLYAKNFAKESWFVDAMAGKSVLQGKRATNVVIDDVTDLNRIYKFSDAPVFAFPIAARVLDGRGEAIGVWVNFVDHDVFKRYVLRDYERMNIVGGDMGASKIRYDLVDSKNTVVLAFRPTDIGKGEFPVELIGKPAAPEITAMGGRIGGERVIAGNVDGWSVIYAKVPPVVGFAGLDWRLVVSAPAHEAAATTIAIAHRILAAAAIVLIAATLGGWRIGSAIAKPLLAIAGRMTALATGDKRSDVPHLDRGDDVGDMARAVESFRIGAIAKDEADAAAAAARRAAEEERERGETARAAREAELGGVVKTLAHGLGQLSQGALTHRIDDAFSPQFEALRINFNDSLETLRGGMATVVESTQTITASATEITRAADELARRTENQAANLEETTAALNEITTAVRNTAESAESAGALVASARGKAESSGKVVDDTISAMAQIEDSSRQVGQILSVIDEIAFQTNLLALNAGVEAARAGDAGKGFAVVAQEVRALAQRSSDAGKEIKTLIARSGENVGAGVRLVSEVAANLKEIVSEVNQLNGAVREISSSTREQATSLQQINTAVGQLDQMTQHNASMVEESTAASHTLANEAAALRDMTERFDVGAGNSPGATRRAA